MRTLLAVTCVAPFLITAVNADITPEDVWQAWQAGAGRNGLTLVATSRTGAEGARTLSDVSLAGAWFEARLSGDSAAIGLTPQADGTVGITLPATFGIALTDPSAADRKSETIAVRDAGARIVASGRPDAISYRFEVPELGVSYRRSDGADGNFNLTLKNLLATEQPGEDGMRTTDLRLSDYDLQLVVGATGEEFSMRETATAKDVHLRATFAWPDDLSLAGFKQALEDGRFVEVVMATGTSSATVSSANEGVLSGSKKSGASEATFRLDRAGLAFVGTVNALEYDVSSPGLPRSLTKIAKAAFDVLLPITRTEGPQKFVYTIDLDGLEIGDELWALFDPGHALPRDPATVIVDLRGTATTLTDVFAIGAGAAMPEPPFKIDTASLARLRIDAAGAQLAGTGNIVFDYEDDTFVPSGSGDFTLTGGNALLDTLVRIGALPAEQASSARMMLGLLARPGKGDDTLISKIEARDGGRIVANGQPLN